MTSEIRKKNDNFKILKSQLKITPKSFIEMDNIFSNTKDKKAFIYLFDSIETEKEITREILEGLIENIIEINTDYINILETNSTNNLDIMKIINNIFRVENAKGLIILALTLGIFITVINSEPLANKALDVISKYVSTTKE